MAKSDRKEDPKNEKYDLNPADFFKPWEGDPITDWESAQDAIQKIITMSNTSSKLVWRGVSNKNYALHSSLYRTLFEALKTPPTENQLQEAEKDILEAARNQWRFDNLTAFETFAHIQHYGGPTRLLDVSFNPLIALWFAVEEKFDSEGKSKRDIDGRLFAFDVMKKRKLTLESAGHEVPWHNQDANWRTEWVTGLSVIWRPPSYNDRIPAQNSAFLIGGVPGKIYKTPWRYRKHPGPTPPKIIWEWLAGIIKAALLKNHVVEEINRKIAREIAKKLTEEITEDLHTLLHNRGSEYYNLNPNYEVSVVTNALGKNKEDVNHLIKEKIEGLIKEKIEDLTNREIDYLTKKQTEYLTKKYIEYLNKEHIDELTKEYIEELTKENIEYLNKEHIDELTKKLNYRLPSKHPEKDIWETEEILQATSINLSFNTRTKKSRIKSSPNFTITIAAEAKKEIREKLKSEFGYGTASIYPDLYGLGNHVKKDLDIVKISRVRE